MPWLIAKMIGPKALKYFASKDFVWAIRALDKLTESDKKEPSQADDNYIPKEH